VSLGIGYRVISYLVQILCRELGIISGKFLNLYVPCELTTATCELTTATCELNTTTCELTNVM
jgi:hypothetical protein